MRASLRILILVAVIALSITRTAATQFSTDVTDLWWNPSESGWGMQVVQEADTIFVTLYVYDAAGNPTWFVATGVWQGNYVWIGDLYQTTGPFFGAPVFNPGTVGATKVGTLTFTLATVNTATTSYTVNGIAVMKQVQRQTLKNDNYDGVYVGQFKNMLSCTNPALNTTVIVPVTLTVSQGGGSVFTMTTAGGGVSCTYGGTFVQAGRFGNVNSGNYSCTDGTAGTFNFFEMYVNISGFSGRGNIQNLQNGQCTATTHLGGMRQ
jgi:hypothetical protein